MTDTEMLEKIKVRLSITTNYQDNLLSGYIADIKEFLLMAGVPVSALDDKKAIGCITRGVVDLWNFGAGAGSFSDTFKMQAIQLQTRKEV